MNTSERTGAEYVLEKISESSSDKTFYFLYYHQKSKFPTSHKASPASGAFRKSILSLLEYLSNINSSCMETFMYPLFLILDQKHCRSSCARQYIVFHLVKHALVYENKPSDNGQTAKTFSTCIKYTNWITPIQM